MVERNIEKISGLTQDLLNFCRERDPEREPVNPNDLIREVFDLFHVQCQQQGVHLNLDLEQDMETVDLDPKGIQEVLINLTGNAIDACTLGKTAIQNPEAYIRSRLLPEEKILLEVRDNGMGMDQEVRTKII